MATRKKVGMFSVDAGICWIGDPCYILHRGKKGNPAGIGKDWQDFCNITFQKEKDGVTTLDHAPGNPGLGVVVSTGYGDGCYPVYVEWEDGRVARVYIEFMGDDSDDMDSED